jgi:nucleoside-diphosphate-sugar epimerase
MSLLVTGANSGLGRYLHRRFDAVPLTRATSLAELVATRDNAPFDAIVHCAASAHRGVTNRTLYRYLADNLLLTRDLCAIPHRRFIYISSIAVYPPDSAETSPDTVIPCDDSRDLYRLMKLGGESIAREHGAQSLILRVSGMLGPDARPNSITRILTDLEPALTLSAESTFNYVLHQDIGDFITHALEQSCDGIYNVAAAENVRLGDIASQFERTVRWGGFIYRTPAIDTEAAIELLPSLKRTTLENVKRYHARLASATESS